MAGWSVCQVNEVKTATRHGIGASTYGCTLGRRHVEQNLETLVRIEIKDSPILAAGDRTWK